MSSASFREMIPELKNEYVVLTAHLDHTGVNQKLIDEGKDGINNGALDNAMGVATMLEAVKRLVDEGLWREASLFSP